MCSFYKAVAQFAGTEQLILTCHNSEAHFLCVPSNTLLKQIIMGRHGKGMKIGRIGKLFFHKKIIITLNN